VEGNGRKRRREKWPGRVEGEGGVEESIVPIKSLIWKVCRGLDCGRMGEGRRKERSSIKRILIIFVLFLSLLKVRRFEVSRYRNFHTGKIMEALEIQFQAVMIFS